MIGQRSGKEPLRRYLLGETADEERSVIEQRLLTDQDYFNELLKIEEELIDEYTRGGLKGAEREKFELLFAHDPERREGIEFAKAFNQYLSAQNIQTQPGSDRAQAWYGSMPALSPQWRAVLGAAACVILLLAAGLVLLFRETRVQRAQWEQREREFIQQSEQQQARYSEFSKQFGLQQEELAQLRQELAKVLSPRGWPSPESGTVALLLAPGLSRAVNQTSTANQTSIANLLSTTQRLRLNLEIGEGNYKSYWAEIQTVEGDVVSSQEGLKAHRTTRNKVVVIVLPTALLSRSDYLVMLSGTTATGASEKIGSYYFKILRK
jgi:hypothetical protein